MTETVEQPVANAEGSAAPEPSAPSNVVTLDSGQTVTLHPAVTIPIGVAALSVIRQGGGRAVIEGGLAEVYLRLGIEAWSFTEIDPESNRAVPVPVTPENTARLLPFAAGGLEVAERADALYSPVVMRPLLKRQAAFLAAMQTEPSTSPPSDGGSKPPKRSASSSSDGSEPSPAA